MNPIKSLFKIKEGPIRSTTQNHVPVAEIVDGMVFLKDGSAAIVLESTSLNFALLSPAEQKAVIAAYAAFLNSLTFPTQILIRSERKDITNYLIYLNQESQKIKNPKLASLMETYKVFVKETIKKKQVLGKRFFIIAPFSRLELGLGKSFSKSLKKEGPLPVDRDYLIKKAKVSLYPKRDHLIRQSSRAGLTLRQLSTTQLIELFYQIYNIGEEEKSGTLTERRIEKEEAL
ncbi:hypothetical protein A2961_02925 [Candidatus Woesebacteria bacterium RIFCSPLOWO2_01_FULL_39_21]|uniref:Uncharacterized protein n=1 Tax=Candidatus Woesebacteria bacterium RIFCSPLOWO2_01_FULL_39_21 TaxID=1802519 RepID=A0A1F8BKW5_9BACT|nr:MAG: hypothetical protein A2691_01535 [Candidatus Woesebacteria bacterium RIFCSPHIGHO2_01_FULL_39_23]OGM64717.1 MAG: hypothetical protein A2961_02925 [Candidatus Woesebacteria bacterium RIFCSPLOWO2_01_FULL_39_21]